MGLTTLPTPDTTRTGAPPEREGCALVTGGSRGIGAAVARALAADGWPVALTYRSGAGEARELADALGESAVALQADVTAPDAADELVAAAEDALGLPLAVLVNNAGITADGLAVQLDDDAWDRVIDTNLSAAFRLTRRAVRGMVRRRHGRVINISSVVGVRANPGQANYAASKAGLIAMTKTVAVEVARRGVTVNAVAPGFIETDMTAGLPDGVLDHIPAKRVGRPDEVAAAVRFLASDEAAYITGATLAVDGGMGADRLQHRSRPPQGGAPSCPPPSPSSRSSPSSTTRSPSSAPIATRSPTTRPGRSSTSTRSTSPS
jgi:3-oxoacyl-[acyl-carrier protein] reductase